MTIRTFCIPVLLLALLLVAAPRGVLQAQELKWATSAGGIGEDQALGIALDARGNSYVTGGYSGTATFGAGETNETVLTATGTARDIFIAKYGPDGALLWARSAGGGGVDEARRVATDARGNSYITGRFAGPATFGVGEVNETVLTAAGDPDIFVAKYAADGSLLWARSAGGIGFSTGIAIATDARGNSYVTGGYSGSATFGLGEANETVLTAVSSPDVYVAKYAPDGTLQWARSAGGIGGDQGVGIATDPRGNIHVTGNFFGMLTFGFGEANETVLTSAGGPTEIFVAKYAPDGTFLWARSAGSIGDDQGNRIATDARGNSYVTGLYSGIAMFGAGETNETALTANGTSRDIFVAKYAADGTLLWATSAGGSGGGAGGGDAGIDIATDARGNSYVAGIFSGMATFGGGEAKETVLTAVGSHDVFVAKYAPDGTLVWATSAGSSGFSRGHGIATDVRGDIHVAGYFSGIVTFGFGNANETMLTAAGAPSDIFVAKYSTGAM